MWNEIPLTILTHELIRAPFSNLEALGLSRLCCFPSVEMKSLYLEWLEAIIRMGGLHKWVRSVNKRRNVDRCPKKSGIFYLSPWLVDI